MHFVKILTLMVLIILIFMVALALNTLRKGGQLKVDNFCKKGISVPVKKGAFINQTSPPLVYPQEDTTYTIDINC